MRAKRPSTGRPVGKRIVPPRGIGKFSPRTRVYALCRRDWEEMAELGVREDQLPPHIGLGVVLSYQNHLGTERFPYRVRLCDGRTFCYAEEDLRRAESEGVHADEA